MDKYFKPFKTGLIDVEERYPCGRKAGNKTEARVFYRCKCVCGKEFILTGQELSKHPYSWDKTAIAFGNCFSSFRIFFSMDWRLRI